MIHYRFIKLTRDELALLDSFLTMIEEDDYLAEDDGIFLDILSELNSPDPSSDRWFRIAVRHHGFDPRIINTPDL
jgi:hypothetical protein